MRARGFAVLLWRWQLWDDEDKEVKSDLRAFPGSAVAKSLFSRGREPSMIPGQGTRSCKTAAKNSTYLQWRSKRPWPDADKWTHNKKKKKRKKVTWTFETRNVSLVKSVAKMKKWYEGKQMVWMVERQVLFLTCWVGVCSKPPPYEPSSCELSEIWTCSYVHSH